MKEELIKILNLKLRQIRNNINDLNKFNEQITLEEEGLKYIEDAIGVFKAEEHGFDIYKFVDIDRETFNKLLINLSNEVLTKFGTDSCNYDGLVYLITGINNGISLTLTQEQVDAINLFIDKLLEKENEYENLIAKLNEEKQRLAIKDLDVLKELENKYGLIIENIDDKKYVTEIDEIIEAMHYSEIDNQRVFDILSYLLKYNADIYKESSKKDEVLEKKDESFEKIDLLKPFEVEDDDLNTAIDKNLAFNDFKIDDETKEDSDIEDNQLPTFTSNYDDETNNSEEINSTFENDELSTLEIGDDEETEKNEYNPILPTFGEEGYYESKTNEEDNKEVLGQSIDVVLPEIELDLPTSDEELEEKINIPIEENNENALEIDEPIEDNRNNSSEDSDLNNLEFVENDKPVEDASDDFRDAFTSEELAENNQEIVDVFKEYNFDFNDFDDLTKNILLRGKIGEYQETLAKLKEHNLLKYFQKNANILSQMVLYSNKNILDKVMEIVKNDLSLDRSDDYAVVSLIVAKSMPSIFIDSENGNYQNFIKNVEMFKRSGIDLINLFDFSREVFVGDNKLIENNYQIVNGYGLTVNAYNAKYLLLLKNISSKIDYYVEAMYKDNSTDGISKMFDGLEMIKLYPSKLTTVSGETLKRLRYSSENGLKVFGSKEKSLAGEITNLGGNYVDMTEEYLKSLFNNQFDIIERDEVANYLKLINTNEYVPLNEVGLLTKLSGYKVGLRYCIGNINVSANKVIRIYNILINNGVDEKKALLFAICYNLTITETEYERIKAIVNSMGGN